jgi:hypothetical protein
MNLERYNRLRETEIFRQGRHGRWRQASLCIIGAGALGARLALEAVLSGVGKILVIDPDVGEEVNLGTQCVSIGEPKVQTTVKHCDVVRPGVARGLEADIRHVGIGLLHTMNLLIDTTDDAALALPLTEISHGLGVPLLRLAVDGSGRREMGRVFCAGSAPGHACQICSYRLNDLVSRLPRVSCPGAQPGQAEPTLAGGPISMMIAGLGLLQAQRLITGHDLELVLDREIYLDLKSHQVLPLKLKRSKRCLSGHIRWSFTEIEGSPKDITPADLFATARKHLEEKDITLEAYAHPLNVEALCGCGSTRRGIAGSRWAPPPPCPRCASSMSWQPVSQLSHWSEAMAEEAGFLRTPLSALGLPEEGPLIVARCKAKPTLRMLLVDETEKPKP